MTVEAPRSPGGAGRGHEPQELQAFLLALGRALSLAGAAVGEIQDRLARVAASHSAGGARILVFPTAVLVMAGPEDWARVEAIPQLGGTLRLDQISAVYELAGEAEAGRVDPTDGVARLEAIAAMRPRHGAVVAILAYGVMTVGFCLVLQPAPIDLLTAFVFGLLVGTIRHLTLDRPALTVLVPVACAVLVSALCFEAVKHGAANPGLRPLIAPLITFLPGAALTTATVELASGEMVAGASRLISGSVQLFLLAFGIVVGAEIVGRPSAQALQDAPTDLLGDWAPWLGVLVFGLAVAVHFSAPRGSLRWLLFVLGVAWVGQLLGEVLAGADVSGFFGALAMTPVALAVARVHGAPPSQVTFLPAFWLLVPGALGLIGVTEVVGDPATASIDQLIAPMGSIVSIALGVLCGVSLFRALEAAWPARRWA